jgi:hypothetical protein
MNALTDWFCANKLSLNMSKTNFILFKPKRVSKDCDISRLDLGSESMERVRCTTFLGIYIDDELEWTDHIDHVAKKIASGSYAIRAAKQTLSIENLKSLYYSLVHSHLTYGNMVWGSAYQYRLNKLVKLQKKMYTQCMQGHLQ